jgi:hypothetical protein
MVISSVRTLAAAWISSSQFRVATGKLSPASDCSVQRCLTGKATVLDSMQTYSAGQEMKSRHTGTNHKGTEACQVWLITISLQSILDS